MVTEKQNSMDIIKILLDLLEHDRKYVMLFVAICFGIPTFTLSKIEILSTPLIVRVFLLISLASFMLSGLGYFFYSQKIHRKRFKGLQNIMDLDHEGLRRILFGINEGVWAKAAKYYNIAKFFLVVASIFYILFFILFIFKIELFA